LVATVVGALAANALGWYAGEWLLDDAGIVERLLAGAGLIGSAAVIYFVDKISRPALALTVPVMLYFCLVLGAWNGYAADFDSVRVAAIQHHFANGYALEHMSGKARADSCADTRIRLSDDARPICSKYAS
jgi:hypothetical protein